MPPTIITKESLYKRITALERQHCCNKNQFFDNSTEFPATGNTEVLYTDLSTGNIYIWNGAEYITADLLPEARLCLNTATPAFAPIDTNNPTTAEVEAYVLANAVDTNGTQIVYFVAGDGGSCDSPDYVWTLNDNEITLSNKEEKTNGIVYVDTLKGSNTTGLRNYPHFPYKNFTQAIVSLQDGDWIKYNNTGESISGTNVSPSLTKHYYDFGANNITLNSGGNAFIGPQSFTPTLRKDVIIKSDGLFTSNKVIGSFRNGEINLDLNKWVNSSYAFASKDNVNIKVNELITSVFFPLGFFSPSNKNFNINIKSLTLNNSATSGYIPAVFSPEVNGEESIKNRFSVNFENVLFNSSFGGLFLIYSGPFFIKDSTFNFEVLNFMQSSDFTAYNHSDSGSVTKSILKISANDSGGKLDNNKINLKVKNQDSDISVQYEGVTTTCNINNCLINILVENSIVRKLSSFKFSSIPVVFSNSKQFVSGNYINLSDQPIIDIRGLQLTNNSVFEFSGTFKSNTNISITGLTIDATSKIIFKGRYEFGAGYFDISGVTGAGADNVYFEDCTIVTDNAECIVSGSAKNVKILNVRSNKPVNANVTELVSSILVNANIN